jgi:hypothetical protein
MATPVYSLLEMFGSSRHAHSSDWQCAAAALAAYSCSWLCRMSCASLQFGKKKKTWVNFTREWIALRNFEKPTRLKAGTASQTGSTPFSVRLLDSQLSHPSFCQTPFVFCHFLGRIRHQFSLHSRAPLLILWMRNSWLTFGFSAAKLMIKLMASF